MSFFRQRKADVPMDWSEMPVEGTIEVQPYTTGENWKAHARVTAHGPNNHYLILEEYNDTETAEEGQVWAESRLSELAAELRRRAVRDAQAIQIKKSL